MKMPTTMQVPTTTENAIPQRCTHHHRGVHSAWQIPPHRGSTTMGVPIPQRIPLKSFVNRVFHPLQSISIPTGSAPLAVPTCLMSL